MNPPSLPDQAVLSLKRLKPRWRTRFLQQPAATEAQWQHGVVMREMHSREVADAAWDKVVGAEGGRVREALFAEEPEEASCVAVGNVLISWGRRGR